MTDEPRCRWNGPTSARVLPGRHGGECDGEGCDGCQPCTERHCIVCRRNHAEVACASCVGDVRDDLGNIAELCGYSLVDEALLAGVDSEAAMLLGPAADREAWEHRAMSAMQGRVSAAYLEDCRDEQHPLWVLGSWEMLWREHLSHHTDEQITVVKAAGYLSLQLTYMGGQIEPDFAQFAREIRGCRSHLEDVLNEGEREETGAPCPECREAGIQSPPALVLQRVDADRTGNSDRWRCPRCKHSWSEEQYRARVDDQHIEYADELTMTDMAKRTLTAPGTLRRWASKQRRVIAGEIVFDPPKLRPSGKHPDGRRLYRVTDVLNLRDGEDAGAVA